MDSSRQICRKLPNTSPASLDGEGDTVVLFSQGGAGENDIRLDCFSRKVFAGTKDSAGCIGPVRWPAAAECLTR